MSRRINVNPDHYKGAGRERQGENIVHAVEKQEAGRLRHEEQLFGGKPPSSGAKPREKPSEEKRKK
jgi:hypothetical protein